MCERSRVASSRCRFVQVFTGFNDGTVEVHLLGSYTIPFVSCDSARVDADVNNFFSFDTDDVCQEELSFNLGRFWP